MEESGMKRLILIAVILLSTVFIAGADSSCESSTEKKAPESGPGSAAAPIVVEPAVLVQEFDANKINAQDKYNGKVVQTSGFITNISNVGDSFYLQIAPANDPMYLGTSFQCYVSKDDAGSVAKGQQISFKGTVQDVSITMIQFKDCSVIK